MSAVLFDATLTILIYRMTQMRLRLDYPAFYLYLAATLVIDLIPNPKDPQNWITLWYASCILLIALRTLAIIEVFWFCVLGMNRSERIGLLTGLLMGAAACLALFIPVTDPARPLLHNFTLLRQCISLAMASWMTVGGLALWMARSNISTNTRRHFVIFTALLLIKTTIAMLDLKTGLIPRFTEGPLMIWDCIGESACFIAWSISLQTPARHWWVLVGTSAQRIPTSGV